MMRHWLLCVLVCVLACERVSVDEWPQIESIEPQFWEFGDPPTEPLIIRGRNFYVRVRTDQTPDHTLATDDQFRATVGSATGVVRRIDNNTLEMPAPSLPIGRYSVAVTTPGGERAELRDAIEVIEPGSTPVAGRGGPALIGADQTETTVPIDPVDPASSILFFNVTHASDEPGTGLVAGWLADDGHSVTFARNTTTLFYDPEQPANEEVSIRWSVVQLSGIRVLRGRVVFGPGLQQDVQLPATFDTTRSFVLATHTLDGTHFAGNDWVGARLIDNQTLRFNFWQAGEFAVVAWQVVEIANGTVESGDAALTGGATSISVSLPPAALEHSMLLFTETVHSDYDTDGASSLVSGRLSSTTEIIFERYIGPTAVDVDLSWFRVTWPRMQVQHGDVPFASGETTKIVALASSVSRARSVGLLAGQLRQSMAEQYDDRVGAGWFITELEADGAQLRLTRAVADSQARAFWQVVEFL